MRAAALAVALTLGAIPAGAGDYRAEIMVQVIRPCFVELARHRLGAGVSREAAVDAVIARNRQAVERLVDRINGQLENDPPAVARRQIYRVALRSCLRQGAAALGLR